MRHWAAGGERKRECASQEVRLFCWEVSKKKIELGSEKMKEKELENKQEED